MKTEWANKFSNHRATFPFSHTLQQLTSGIRPAEQPGPSLHDDIVMQFPGIT